MTPCEHKGCDKPAIYHVYKYKTVNRFFCGRHVIKYWRILEGDVFKAKLLEQPYRPSYDISVLDTEVRKLTRQEIERLRKHGGSRSWWNSYRHKWQKSKL